MAGSTVYQAILFPADDRMPHLVPLATTPLPTAGMRGIAEPYRCGRLPHPEVFMEYIADGAGAAACGYRVIEILDGMTEKFSMPWVVFYPVISRDGMPFPENAFARAVQGSHFFEETRAWRGNLVVAKYRDLQYSAMTDASMADFPMIKNWLQTHRVQ